MPSRLSHVVVFSDDAEETARFLVDVVGMKDPRWFDAPGAQNAVAFGWPPDVDTRRVLVGEGPGMMEVVAIPPSLRGTVQPGVAFLSFATVDVEGCAERAGAAGFETGPTKVIDGGGTSSTLAVVEAGGLPFQFIRFGT